MKRREFFGTAAASAGAAALAAQTGQLKAGDIPRRTLGKTGEKLTIIGPAGGRFGMCGFEDAKAIVRRACDLGVNYYDNARLYWGGRSEEVFGEVLAPVRKNVFITTKCARYTKAAAEADLEASLKALRTDYIDLWQVHQVSEMKEVEEIFGPNGSLPVFEAAKKAGKVRFIGFTGHRDPHVHLEMLKRYDKWDTILMPINPADPSYLSFEKLVLPVAVERGMGIQAMKSTANSKLLHSIGIRECLSYVLSLPVHVVAMGATTIGQIEDDVRIAQQFQPLTADRMEELRKRASRFAGPQMEDWKRNVKAAANAPLYRDGVLS
ncbi:MAG TPA: aldo/keto reductase [Bryobacteraceae bacterium]|nr:aldo/keto reductase [Bryobacteraceae bacterium]